MTPYAEPLDFLSIPKTEFDPNRHKEEDFYKDKQGNIFPYLKQDIKAVVNPFKPRTFFPLLQELDIPFYEEYWLEFILKTSVYNNQGKFTLENVFGRYLGLMKLRGFRDFGFQDSSKWFHNYWDYLSAEYKMLNGIIYRKDLIRDSEN